MSYQTCLCGHYHKKANYNWFKPHQLAKQRNKAILSLLIHQGLTTPEITKLTNNDLQFKEGKLHITGNRKSNARTLTLQSHQIIPLMDYQCTTRKALLQYQQEPETHQLFLSTPTAGKQKTNNNNLQIWKGLRNDIRKYHPKFINFRQLRTSVITHWLKQYNLREVQQMAGHRYISSTEAYIANQTEDLQADIDQFHPY